MADAPPLNRRRYRFVRDRLTERPPLRKTALGLTKGDEHVRGFLGDGAAYLERLAGGTDGADCPFCVFEVAASERAYRTENGMETFVSTVETHRRLWERGLLLTYNPDGWHLVNELVVPRTHLSGDELLDGSLDTCLSVVRDRWRRHLNGIESVVDPAGTAALRHGAVVNYRTGQSVTHGHVHCYTSVHDSRTYPDARVPLISRTTGATTASVSLVPFDVPRVVMSVRGEMSPDIGTAFVTACIETFADLCGAAQPASIGWFHPARTNRHLLLYHPMQRDGTLQAFQTATLHKFEASALADVLSPKLASSLRLPGERDESS